MTRILKVGFAIAFAALMVAFVMLAVNVDNSTAAPMPAPTPVSAAPRGIESSKVNFFDGDVMTADQVSSCADISAYEKADLYYNIDVSGSAIVTTYLQFGNDPTALVDGVAVVAAASADAADMNQYQVFGNYMCLRVDVATTDTITVTANALVK